MGTRYSDLGGNNRNGVQLSGVRTSRSGSITLGGTAQVLAAANAQRRQLELQNISDEDMWINDNGGTAAADTVGSFKVPAGEIFITSSNKAVSIVSATTGKKFSAFEE